MNILNLSLDRSLASAESKTRARLLDYGTVVREFIVISLALTASRIMLSPQVEIITVPDYGGKLAAWWRLKRQAREVLRAHQIDVITVQDTSFVALLGWWLARRYHTGLEIQVHGFEKLSWIRRTLTRFVSVRASVIRVVSERLKKLLIEEFGAASSRIQVIPIYVAPRSGGSVEKINRPLQAIIFLTAGRLVPVKNIMLQLRALAALRRAVPHAMLWVVGDGPLRPSLEQEARRLEISEAITFFGQQHDLASFYAAADVFLLTSYSEGWPLVVAEAAHHGLPIIMTDVGPAGELVRDGESGVVIPINDARVLVEKMRLLAENPAMRQRLGESIRRAAAALPSKTAILKRYRVAWESAQTKKL